MNFAAIAGKKLVPLGVIALCAIGLGGCFDLEQKVAIGRDGSGGYAIAIKADGLVGDALNKKKADIDVGDMPMTTRVEKIDGKVIQTSGVGFHDLSELKLSDETISLHVKGKKLLGIGGTEMAFHRSFRVDHARAHNSDDDDKNLGKDILASMFGDHTYTFSVWLPGEIDKAQSIDVGDRTIEPTITPAGEGHTVAWRMKLTDMFLADTLDFDVDFTARGDFHDTETGRAIHHHRHHDDT